MSLCFTDPGFDTDVTVEASLSTLYPVWLGTVTLTIAVRDGPVTHAGPREVVRRLPDPPRLSLAAPDVRRGRARAAAG